MSKDEGKETKVLESEKILEQINAMQAGKTPPVESVNKQSEEKTKEPEPTTSEKAPKPTMETEAAPQGKAEETKALDDKKSGKPDVDIREWAKRKGIKENDTESVLKAYREAERKISQLTAEAKRTDVPQDVPRGTQPAWTPQPQLPPWQPPMPTWTPQPSYPPPYVDRRAIIEQEAQRFNMTPEDFERVLPLVNEVTDLKLNRNQAMLQAKYDSQLAELQRGNRRSEEFNHLMADPLFTTPAVAFEIDQLMAENPQRLKLEPTPWTNLFKDALERIARKQLSVQPTDAEGPQLPSTPPKEGGRGSSPGIPVSHTSTDILNNFKKLDATEMEKQLASMGAIPPSH